MLEGLRVARIGPAPDGFDTCRFDSAEVARRFGAEVEELELAELFDTARAAEDAPVAALRERAAAELDGLDAVDQKELDRSLRLKLALDAIRERRGIDAFAIRCWPETFTEYGGAVCGPVAMLGEARVPCACEADVWGALTQMALQRIADAPVFLVDLVDVDPGDDTSVVWHCGQAPLSMAAGGARATIHTNRRMPLLYEFPLRPGRVTFLRLSQARGTPKVVIAAGEVLDRPSAFTGTSGVVRFDAPAARVLERVMDSGLEHHMALVYGDHSDALARLAASLDMPIINLVDSQ
jgi:L-fucose isomerase-like protein